MSEQNVMEFLMWWVPRVAGVLLGAMAIEWVLRRRGGGRCGAMLWKGVFVLIVAAPVLALVLPVVEVAVPAGVDLTAGENGVPVEVGAAGTPGGEILAAGPIEIETAGFGAVEWALLVWGGAVALLGMRWLAGIVVAARMRSGATPVEWSEVTRGIEGRVPGVLESRDVVSPVLVGVLRPVVLVPKGSGEWSDEQKRMVLLHEMAHARGKDVFFSILAGAVCVVQWFNPLAWTARRFLVRWQERVADEAVMAGGGDAKRYASFLVELAGGWRREPLMGLATKAMARPAGIEQRVEKILVWRKEEGRPSAWMRRVLWGVFAVVLVLVSVEVEAKDGEVKEAAEGAMYTRTYRVPPDILSRAGEKRETALEALKDLGVELPAGSNAIFSPEDSRLVVRTTEAGMRVVEKVIDKIATEVQRQIFYATRMVEIERGEKKSVLAGALDSPVGDGKYAITGVFTDPQLQVILRAFATAGKKIDAMPSVVVRSGQKATVEVENLLKLALVGTPSEDGYTIDLNVDFGEKTKTAVTVWDGQTVGFLSEESGDHLRYVFVTARLIDPAGQPINAVRAPAKVLDTAKKLDSIVMPALAFEDARLKDVVEFLRQEAKLRDPEGKGVNLVLVADAEKRLESAKITLNLTDVPLGMVLKYVGQLGGCELLVEDTGVTLRLAGSGEKVVKKKPATSGYIETKLKNIVIPVMMFDQASVEDAIEFLRRKSAELDTSEKDKSKRGVNFVIKAGSPDALEGKTVTLSLTDVPLAEAVKYICELSGCESEVTEYAVVVKVKQ